MDKLIFFTVLIGIIAFVCYKVKSFVSLHRKIKYICFHDPSGTDNDQYFCDKLLLNTRLCYYEVTDITEIRVSLDDVYDYVIYSTSAYGWVIKDKQLRNYYIHAINNTFNALLQINGRKAYKNDKRMILGEKEYKLWNKIINRNNG